MTRKNRCMRSWQDGVGMFSHLRHLNMCRAQSSGHIQYVLACTYTPIYTLLFCHGHGHGHGLIDTCTPDRIVGDLGSHGAMIYMLKHKSVWMHRTHDRIVWRCWVMWDIPTCETCCAEGTYTWTAPWLRHFALRFSRLRAVACLLWVVIHTYIVCKKVIFTICCLFGMFMLVLF